MLSYQHIYHAGNSADILKHLSLVTILTALNKKAKPYCVFDTHAAAGRYDLQDERVAKTGEARAGIFRLLSACADFAQHEVPENLSVYLSLVKECLAAGFYPGSPEIFRSLLRAGDALILSELHPQEIENLRLNMKAKKIPANGTCIESAPEIHVHFRDGFETVRALTPPKIKRGLVLIDPSYEEASDYTKVARAACDVHEKWSGAIIAIWYPVLAHRKNDLKILKDTIIASVKTAKVPAEISDIQLENKPPRLQSEHAHLSGSGMLVVNSPWKFAEDLEASLQFVRSFLRNDRAAEML